jgi:hypothetical protein
MPYCEVHGFIDQCGTCPGAEPNTSAPLLVMSTRQAVRTSRQLCRRLYDATSTRPGVPSSACLLAIPDMVCIAGHVGPVLFPGTGIAASAITDPPPATAYLRRSGHLDKYR